MTWLAAATLISAAVVLLAAWAWLRSARPHARSRLRHLAPVTGGLLLLAGGLTGRIHDQIAPDTFGWYAYSPLTGSTFPPVVVADQSLAAREIAAALAVAGLAALTATAAFRAGRRETR